MRALQQWVSRLSSVFREIIPVFVEDEVNDDPDTFLMLLEEGPGAVEVAFHRVEDREYASGVDPRLAHAEYKAGGYHICQEVHTG